MPASHQILSQTWEAGQGYEGTAKAKRFLFLLFVLSLYLIFVPVKPFKATDDSEQKSARETMLLILQ